MQGRGHRASARACTACGSAAMLQVRPFGGPSDNATEAVTARQLCGEQQGTVFRQTQVADFELRAHEMVEKGQRLTSEPLDKYADAVAWHPFRDATPSTCPHTDAGSIRRTPTCGSRNRSARAYPAARAFSDRRVC